MSIRIHFSVGSIFILGFIPLTEGEHNLTEYEGISGPGDRGGPAFIIKDNNIYIVEISSGQSTKNSGGVEGLYGVREYYVRISQYVKWIKKNIRKTVTDNQYNNKPSIGRPASIGPVGKHLFESNLN